MRITDISAVYPQYRHVTPSWRTHLWQTVVRVDTDSGVCGYGCGGGGRAAVEVVNRHFRELLIGRAVNGVQDLTTIWDYLYSASMPYGRKGIATMALSGVDLALWDLLGQAERMPVHQLLGPAVKNKVRAYATGPDAEWYGDLGFTAHKFSQLWTGNPSDYDAAMSSAARSREVLGSNALVMIDAYMSWDVNVTLEMARRLDGYNIHWFEDVLTPDDLEAQAMLRSHVKPVLIAGGEHEFTHHGFAEVARRGALDVWQPDVTWSGGITAALRIVELAKQSDVPVVPHRGGEVWGLHLIVASDCEDLAELVLGTRNMPRDVLWTGEPEMVSGFLMVPDRPGFGVTPNEELL